jgi:hypothetical protein
MDINIYIRGTITYCRNKRFQNRGSDEIFIIVTTPPSPLYKVDKVMRRNLSGFN